MARPLSSCPKVWVTTHEEVQRKQGRGPPTQEIASPFPAHHAFPHLEMWPDSFPQIKVKFRFPEVFLK